MCEIIQSDLTRTTCVITASESLDNLLKRNSQKALLNSFERKRQGFPLQSLSVRSFGKYCGE